ncbi:MAG TPA: enoyl-CoA hydratase/isomerase family protein [Vicinamibacterales bacterium]|nr:enoyl-CoA hydratase/isomerase family protein [Vicinamibacterales bacterium]
MSKTQSIYETDGPLAILTFNRPEARNAMTWEMYEALAEACDRVDADPAVRVFVLRGAGGKAFIAGTDISQFRSFKTADDAIRYEERIEQLVDRLERVTKPTIAQVQGVAAGGGCVIALVCDLRVATSDSTFGVPIARTLGNCLAGVTYSRLADVVGPARAKELLFTGRFVDAEEARALGLVNRIVPDGEIDAAVRELATQIAANAPLTIRATKELNRRLMAARRLPPGADRDLIELCYTSADFREGVAAFLEKRKPKWEGK